jgi:hypothetical protein
MIRKIALDRLILSTAKDTEARRCCDLVVAMLVDRLIAPRSKLGFVRAVDEETAATSLGAVVGLGKVKDHEAYEALDWLLERQAVFDSTSIAHWWSTISAEISPRSHRFRSFSSCNCRFSAARFKLVPARAGPHPETGSIKLSQRPLETRPLGRHLRQHFTLKRREFRAGYGRFAVPDAFFITLKCLAHKATARLSADRSTK